MMGLQNRLPLFWEVGASYSDDVIFTTPPWTPGIQSHMNETFPINKFECNYIYVKWLITQKLVIYNKNMIDEIHRRIDFHKRIQIKKMYWSLGCFPTTDLQTPLRSGHLDITDAQWVLKNDERKISYRVCFPSFF